jgi:pimeloyl-ACP methyl ester carboxylesterase
MPTVNVGDIQIYYEEYGQGQPLIMILGLGQDIATWGFQIAELSKRVRLIVFDNRYFRPDGPSGNRTDPSFGHIHGRYDRTACCSNGS